MLLYIKDRKLKTPFFTGQLILLLLHRNKKNLCFKKLDIHFSRNSPLMNEI